MTKSTINCLLVVECRFRVFAMDDHGAIIRKMHGLVTGAMYELEHTMVTRVLCMEAVQL
jgi:hypothetical protein